MLERDQRRVLELVGIDAIAAPGDSSDQMTRLAELGALSQRAIRLKFSQNLRAGWPSGAGRTPIPRASLLQLP
jgi:hypothetical protein